MRASTCWHAGGRSAWRRRVGMHGTWANGMACCPLLVRAPRLTWCARISTILVPIQSVRARAPMLRVSRLTDYATVVMTCIAAHPADVLSTAQIADETHLELPTVSKLLKALGHAELVESFRGVNGGYRLARPASAIS